MRKLIMVAISATFLVSACANHTHEIPAAYVSPLQYQSFTCSQIGQEMERVSRRAQQVAHDVNKNADGDSTAMGVGLVLFWPALFFIDGDSPQAQEYARLKGEFDALEQAAIQKDCGIKIEEDPFAKIEQERKEDQKAKSKELHQNE